MVNVEDERTLKKSEGQKFYNEEKIYNIAEKGSYEVHHGYLEASNTNAIIEMQAMIQLQKDFEAAQKMVTSLDSIMSRSKDIGRV